MTTLFIFHIMFVYDYDDSNDDGVDSLDDEYDDRYEYNGDNDDNYSNNTLHYCRCSTIMA